MSGSSGIAATHLISFALWTFLPSFLSSFLRQLFYQLFPSYRPPPLTAISPQAHHKLHWQHQVRARVLLVSGYLLFTLVSVYYSQSRPVNLNFYSLVGLTRETIEASAVEGNTSSLIKSHWRKLARQFHPDKVGKQGEDFFVRLKKGVDCLENDKRRWAYDRFGPDVLGWDKLVTEREFLVRGTQGALAFYLIALLSTFVLSLFRREERANSFWRYLILFTALAVEFSLILRPSPSPLFSLIVPNRLPYEHIAFLRQLFISTSMAFSQIVPLLFPAPPPTSSTVVSEQQAIAEVETLKPLLQQLAQLSGITEMEVRNLQSTEVYPLMVQTFEERTKATEEEKGKRERKVLDEVREGMIDRMSELKVRSDSGNQKIWNEAVKSGWEKMGRTNGAKVNGGNPSSPSRPRQAIFSPAPTPPSQTPTLPAIASTPDSIPAPSFSSVLSPPPETTEIQPPSTAVLPDVLAPNPLPSPLPSPIITNGDAPPSISETVIKELDRFAPTTPPASPPSKDTLVLPPSATPSSPIPSTDTSSPDSTLVSPVAASSPILNGKTLKTADATRYQSPPPDE